MSQEMFEQVEIDIHTAKALIRKGEALHRLRNNQDFRDVISEGYFVDDAVRLVHLKCSPAMQNDKEQAGINKSIDAIGSLSIYFSALITQAEMAKSSLAEDENTLAEMSQEGEL